MQMLPMEEMLFSHLKATALRGFYLFYHLARNCDLEGRRRRGRNASPQKQLFNGSGFVVKWRQVPWRENKQRTRIPEQEQNLVP